MKLPVLFKEKMQRLLGDEYEAYLESYNNPKYQGIRINTMKVSDEEWKQINPFTELVRIIIQLLELFSFVF